MRRRNSTNSNLTSPGGRQRVSRTSSTSHRLTLDQGTCQPTLTPKVCPRLPYLVRHRLAQTPPNVWPPFPYPLLHLQLHLLISMTFPPLTRSEERRVGKDIRSRGRPGQCGEVPTRDEALLESDRMRG